MSDSVFTPEGSATPPENAPSPAPDQQPAPEVNQLLGMIVNEQGQPKYKSVEDAMKGLAAAQQHIKTLESDNAALRSKADQATTMEEILQAAQASSGEQAPEPQAPAEPAPQYTEADLANMIEASIAQREAQQSAKANINTVAARAREVYGENAEETFYSKAQEKGLDKETINALAAKSPQAVLDLLGIKDKPASTPAPAAGGTTPFQGKAPEAKVRPMSAVSTGDLVAAWRQSGNAVKQKFGIED